MFVIEDQKMYLTKGDSASLTIDLVDAAGLPESVQTNDVLTLTVRDKPGGNLIFSAENAVGSNEINITHDMTASQKASVYSADIQLKRGQDRYTIWPTRPFDTVGNMGNFVLLPEVTES